MSFEQLTQDLASARGTLQLATDEALERYAATLLSTRRTVVPPGDAVALQAALDRGGVVACDYESEYVRASGFVIRRPQTTILGHMSRLRSTSGPALRVLPGVHETAAYDLVGYTENYQTVFQFGDNGVTQNRPDLIPRDVVCSNLVNPQHRRRRAFEAHCFGVMHRCAAPDVYDVGGSQSQGLSVINSDGAHGVLVVIGGRFTGSECFLTGGDPEDLPGDVAPRVILLGVDMTRPLGWQQEPQRQTVTSVEWKSSDGCIMRGGRVNGCWRNVQAGWAFTATPRSQASVRGLLIQDVPVTNVGGVLNVIGHDSATITPLPTTLAMRGITAVVDHVRFQGVGHLALIAGGVESVDLDDIVFVSTGPKVLEIYRGSYRDASGVTRPAPANRRVSLRNSFCTIGDYGLTVGGVHFGRTSNTAFTLADEHGPIVEELEIENNVFTGTDACMSRMRPRVSASNRFVSRAEFDALVASRLALVA